MTLHVRRGNCSIELYRTVIRTPKKKTNINFFTPEQGRLTHFIRKENSGSEYDIYNKKQVNVEKDADLES